MSQDRASIPCYIRKQFDKLCLNAVTLRTIWGYLYTVEVDVKHDVTVLHGAKWEELVADYDIALETTIMINFPEEENYTFLTQIQNKKRKNKKRIDQSVSAKDFNHDIDYKLERAFYFHGISISDEVRANLHEHVVISGAGAGAIFVHPLSATNIKQCLKLPEPVTTLLRVPQRGDIYIYVRDPDVACLIEYRVDTDGRLATVGSVASEEFVHRVSLKKNQLICVLIFKEMARLVCPCQEDLNELSLPMNFVSRKWPEVMVIAITVGPLCYQNFLVL